MKLMHLLPFMDKEDITQLAEKVMNNEVQGVKLAVLFPFMDREELDNLIDLLIEKGRKRDLYTALPFLSKTSLNKLFEAVKAGKIEGFKEQALLPFLGKDKVKELFDEYVKNAHNEASDESDEDVSDLFDDEEEK
jgi:hypothetical protein